MSTQPQVDGRRPIDRILGPGFTQDLAGQPFEQVRERRLLAEQEEVDLSFARRLLQGRIDLLKDELAGRSANGTHALAGTRSDEVLVHDLASVLTDEGPREDHGLGRHLRVEPTRVGEHRRAAEQAVADLAASDPASMPDAALVEEIEHLRGLEHAVSESRHRVQTVMDTLTGEVTRRYKTGEARVEDVLPVD